MSAYVVDDETINKVVTYLYMESLGGRHFSFHRLKALGYNLSFEEDCKKLAEDMFALNVEAVEQRYGKGEAKKFRPLNFRFRFVENEGIIRTIKALGTWSYQCTEGSVPKTEIYQEMDAIQTSMYVKFAHSTKEWLGEEGGK